MPTSNTARRVYRILRPMKRFHRADDGVVAGGAEDEKLGRYWGTYRDEERVAPEVHVFERGLRIGAGQSGDVLFEEIARIDGPGQKLGKSNVLILTSSDGSVSPVEISGIDGRSRDAFEFLRFLTRVAPHAR